MLACCNCTEVWVLFHIHHLQTNSWRRREGQEGGKNIFAKQVIDVFWLISAHLPQRSFLIIPIPCSQENHRGKKQIIEMINFRGVLKSARYLATLGLLIWLLHSCTVQNRARGTFRKIKNWERAQSSPITSISILHRWSLPAFKGIGGFRLPSWLTFTQCVFLQRFPPIYPTNR